MGIQEATSFPQQAHWRPKSLPQQLLNHIIRMHGWLGSPSKGAVRFTTVRETMFTPVDIFRRNAARESESFDTAVLFQTKHQHNLHQP